MSAQELPHPLTSKPAGRPRQMLALTLAALTLAGCKSVYLQDIGQPPPSAWAVNNLVQTPLPPKRTLRNPT
jgi:hypothetical protein